MFENVPRLSMPRLLTALALLCLSIVRASAQPLPVVFEIDDPEDELFHEEGTARLHELHVEEQVPVVLAVVPCGAGTTLESPTCMNGTFHEQYQHWVAANPHLVEIAQHGYSHDEHLATMSREDQLHYLRRGLEEMQTWGLPRGRPISFAAPFASSNADTISVLEELGFGVSVKDSGTCFGSSTLDVWCTSVHLCELDADGNRVDGRRASSARPRS